MSITVPLLISAINVAFYLYLVRRELLGRGVVLAPVAVFGLVEIVSVWPAAYHAYMDGIVSDGYPAFVIAVSFSMFLFGVLLYRSQRKAQRCPPPRSLVLTDEMHDAHAYWRGCVSLMLVLIVAGLYLYRGLPPQMGLLSQTLRSGHGLLESLQGEMHAYRYDITKSHYFGGAYRGQGAIRSLSTAGWTLILTLIMMRGLYARTKAARRKWFIRLTLGSILAFIFIAGDGTRAPILLVLFTTLCFASHLHRLPRRHAVSAATVLFLMIIGLSLAGSKAAGWRNEDGNVLRTGVRIVLERISMCNGINNVYIVDLIDSGYWDLQQGHVLAGQLYSALPGLRAKHNFANELAETITGRARTTTYATPTLIGLIYADFGILGCLIGYFSLGLLLQHAQSYCLKQMPRSVISAVITLGCIQLSLITLGGIVSFMVRIFLYIFCSIIVLLAIKISSRRRHAWKNTRFLHKEQQPDLMLNHNISNGYCS